jgi:hypothetical protein
MNDSKERERLSDFVFWGFVAALSCVASFVFYLGSTV